MKSPKPYDHVIYRPNSSAREIAGRHLTVLNLIEEMRLRWHESTPFPGNPYDHDEFRKLYSDHHPVRFNIRTNRTEDD